ncbi:MAG TPA: hypothetical protein VI113_11835 [Alphaproteobacteria bacterium]
MTFEQFKYYLDAYGASLGNWPADVREAAERFLASHREASGAQAEAGRLDALLDRCRPMVEPPGVEFLVARIAHRARTVNRAEYDRPRADAVWLWSRAAVLAAVALLGVVIGSIPEEQESDGIRSELAWSNAAALQVDEASFDVAGL